MLVNGNPCVFYGNSRDFWQGDLLSPMVFIFVMEALSRMMHKQFQVDITRFKAVVSRIGS